LATYSKARVLSKLFGALGLFDFIFCFNDVDMLKGIRGFDPTGMPELKNFYIFG
jgi:hypothetical protein